MAPSSRHPVRTGEAELRRDPDRPDGWTLLLDGVPQSHVDLSDPAYLEFDYVRRLGHVVDLAAAAGMPLDVVHLGGGALSVVRYVAATRPGSRQRAFEWDGPLIDLVRRELPLDRSVRLRAREIDARAGLSALRDATSDVVIGDVFAGARTPAHLTSVEFVRDVARVLRPGGTYAANVADGPPLAFARTQVATLSAVFGQVALVADAAVMRGRRFGNLVLIASDAQLPVAALTRRAASDPAPARVVSGGALSDFAGRAAVVTDASAVASPSPPPEIFGAGPARDTR